MRAIWISDFTTADHIGGAEMTSEAIIEACPFEVVQVKTASIGSADLGEHDIVITDSLTQMTNPQAVFALLDAKPFFTVEYDYNKLSPTRHLMTPGDPFLESVEPWAIWFRRFWTHPNLQHAFFMGSSQQAIHHDKWEKAGLKAPSSSVLSSVLSKGTLSFIDRCLAHNEKNGVERSGWLIYNTENPLKGTSKSLDYLEAHQLSPVLLFSKLAPKQLLRTMSRAEGLVFMPTMHDTCPRMAIEAMLLGCEVRLGEMVQHKDEEWFSNSTSARAYLEGRADHFWSTIIQTIQ